MSFYLYDPRRKRLPVKQAMLAKTVIPNTCPQTMRFYAGPLSIATTWATTPLR